MDQPRRHGRPGHAALRRGRTSLEGQVYLVTFTTCGRRPLFRDPELAKAAARAIEDPHLWCRSKLLSWVLMPDHWHGLIQTTDGEPLSGLVQKLKSNTARRVRLAQAAPMRVWSKAFHDHALRAEEDLRGIARYVVLNPVRAGLAARVGDYPYWNAIWL